MRRAIPGPAGELLPPLDASVDRSKPFITRSEHESEREQLDPIHRGQLEFQGAAWNEMLRQMRQRGDEVCDRVLAQPEQAIDKHTHKIPHIAVVVRRITSLISTQLIGLCVDHCNREVERRIRLVQRQKWRNARLHTPYVVSIVAVMTSD